MALLNVFCSEFFRKERNMEKRMEGRKGEYKEGIQVITMYGTRWALEILR